MNSDYNFILLLDEQTNYIYLKYIIIERHDIIYFSKNAAECIYNLHHKSLINNT